MRQYAATIAVLGFFGFALVGWLRGLSADTVALRAGVGMVGLWVLVLVADRLIGEIVPNAPSPPAGGRRVTQGEAGERGDQ